MPSTSSATEQACQVRLASWSEDRDALSLIRRRVFIEEQAVPEELEWEADDAHCLHALAETSLGEPVGTARLLSSGKIGRMAVLPQWRGRGIGSALLRLLIRTARKENLPTPYLDAQTQALAFYQKHGFEAFGEEFMDAGIPHRRMRLQARQPEK